MKRFIVVSIGLAMMLSACQSKTSNEKQVEEIGAANSVSDIVRNPASADGPVDTINVAKMSFEETEYNFGEANAGEVVEHTYKFTNTGKVPLVISDAHSTCGCTIPEWSKDPIPPGESSEIRVRFNTAGKADEQQKPITIIANTYPSETVVYLKGFVRTKS